MAIVKELNKYLPKELTNIIVDFNMISRDEVKENKDHLIKSIPAVHELIERLKIKVKRAVKGKYKRDFREFLKIQFKMDEEKRNFTETRSLYLDDNLYTFYETTITVFITYRITYGQEGRMYSCDRIIYNCI